MNKHGHHLHNKLNGQYLHLHRKKSLKGEKLLILSNSMSVKENELNGQKQ